MACTFGLMPSQSSEYANAIDSGLSSPSSETFPEIKIESGWEGETFWSPVWPKPQSVRHNAKQKVVIDFDAHAAEYVRTRKVHTTQRLSALAGGGVRLTMTVGNLIALRQNNLVRLMAYSGIAQAGYILAPLAVLVVVIGLYPNLLLDKITPSTEAVLDHIEEQTDFVIPERGRLDGVYLAEGS